jgi:hypothetical protein
MKRRGLSLADRPLSRMMLARVHSCLRAQRKRGIVRSEKVGKASAWEWCASLLLAGEQASDRGQLDS